MPKASLSGYTSLSSPSTSNQSPHPTCRPWRQFTSLSSFTRPCALGETLFRLKLNLSYFQTNYLIISLSILFFSLLFHPISLIVFLIAIFLWYYLYFSRELGIVVFNRRIDCRVVLIGLCLFTIVAVGLTGVWLNVLVSVVIGFVFVVFHGVFRKTEDLYFDQLESAESADGGLISVVGSPIRVTGY